MDKDDRTDPNFLGYGVAVGRTGERPWMLARIFDTVQEAEDLIAVHKRDLGDSSRNRWVVRVMDMKQ